MEIGSGAGLARRRDGMLPNFLIIGAMRSGTTALAAYLRAHPDVFMTTKKKEVHFFDLHFHRGVDWYRSWFVDARGERAVGEATPNYMYYEPAADRLAQVIPHSSLIAILRNPVDRAYSHYWRNLARGWETLGFAEAVAAEPDRLAGGDLTTRFNKSYLDRGRYLRQLRRVCERFPRERLHVVIFEQLRDHPVATFEEVCRFIGVDPSFRPPNLGDPVARFKTFRSVGLYHLSRRLPRPVRRSLGGFNVQRSTYPRMDRAIRAELLQRFGEENSALASWLGQDLSVWGN